MTISRFENGHTGGQAETLRKLQAALETAGIEFLPETEGTGGAGVRLRKGPASPLSYFEKFHPFEFEMPYGRGYFGVWRNPDEGFNNWRGLTLLQLSNPRHELDDFEKIWPFWFDVLNTGTILQDILTKALAQMSGPRKPDHPSKLRWDFFQPEDVYPKARRLFANLTIDWQVDPAKIIPNKTSTNFSRHIDAAMMPPLGKEIPWWRLDELDKS